MVITESSLNWGFSSSSFFSFLQLISIFFLHFYLPRFSVLFFLCSTHIWLFYCFVFFCWCFSLGLNSFKFLFFCGLFVLLLFLLVFVVNLLFIYSPCSRSGIQVLNKLQHQAGRQVGAANTFPTYVGCILIFICGVSYGVGERVGVGCLKKEMWIIIFFRVAAIQVEGGGCWFKFPHNIVAVLQICKVVHF